MRTICVWIALAILLLPQFSAAQETQEAVASGSETEATTASTTSKAAALPALSGVWAQQVVTTAVSDVPVIGEVTTTTVALQRVQVRQNGAKLEFVTDTCDLQVDSSVDAISTHIPDKFVASMGTVKRSARLIRSGGDLRLEVPHKIETLGVQLRAPSSEYLPTDTDDPRVVDQDGDGHPGVTVNVRGLIDGSLYIVQRGSDRLRGTVDGANRIKGRVDWTHEQVVLDSTSIFLGDGPATHPHPDADRHRFTMRRVPNGTSCKAIVTKSRSLFSGP